MNNIYRPIEATLEDIIVESPTIKTFVLRPKEDFEFKAGQFIELSIPASARRLLPFSDPNIKDKIDVTIMNVGKITSLLHNSQKNISVGIRGPYGKGYPLDSFARQGYFDCRGGVGLAPLRSLLLRFFAGIDSIIK